jgi:hypothetical protein
MHREWYRDTVLGRVRDEATGAAKAVFYQGLAASAQAAGVGPWITGGRIGDIVRRRPGEVRFRRGRNLV